MSELSKMLERLRQHNSAIAGADPTLAEEVYTGEMLEGGGPLDEELLIEEESIILRRTRPVLAIRDDAAVLEFADQVDCETWKARLIAAADTLDVAIRATGRIDLVGAEMSWVGTGWLVRPDIIVTNAHVAAKFAEADGDRLIFTQIDGRPIRADIDFMREDGRADRRAFQLIEPLLLIQKPGPDIAFFRVEQITGSPRLAAPIPLAASPAVTPLAAVIGYPAFDSRIPDIDLMQRIYGWSYTTKRLAPGAVTYLDTDHLLHDCTTLGGNSGSAVIDLESGAALGLHFRGSFMKTNYAVRSDIVADALDRLERRRPRQPAAPSEAVPTAHVTVTPAQGAAHQGSVTVTVPLQITVALGQPHGAAPLIAEDDDLDVEEARPEDYADRPGYAPNFLGSGAVREVPLPHATGSTADDVLGFDFMGRAETELRYQHFSVVMSRSRRMPLFSAVNIDGSRTHRTPRRGWKRDPRIKDHEQILKECYGNPPRFSRGHMTRRNDPSWGDDFDTADLGNRDSMHVTNVAPQMQAFNAPIWLELEDYALENARDDGMRINVLTGPFLKPRDPVRFGVRIPVRFWKIIAFVHDETHELTATGYVLDQTATLPDDEEFVFGAFTSSHTNAVAQTAIRAIERETGLSFGPLSGRDPFDRNEATELPAPMPLVSRRQLRFR